MKARLFLILIFLTVLTVLITNDKFTLIEPFIFFVYGKEITVGTELTLAVIVLTTLFGVLIVGILEALFFSKKSKTKRE